MKLLAVEGLVTSLRDGRGEWPVVDGVSFTVSAGETVALVGESGCGKTMTALSLLRLVPEPAARISAGAIRFRGEDLLSLDRARLREIRGRGIAMVFQEPMSALNPVLSIGEQVAEAVRLRADRRAARERAIELLRRVGFPEPELRYRAYPHQLSGGMRQRVLIAIALAGDPALLIADEPTTALDLTLQAQVLSLLAELQRERGMGLLLITHDLAIAGSSADRTIVLYAGQVVESGPTRRLLDSPRHPYTAALLRVARALSLARSASAPARVPGRGRSTSDPASLPEIPGAVPDARAWPAGCRFADRCPRADAPCRGSLPALVAGEGDRELRCLHPIDETDRGDP